jgi:hypothetical protein
MSAFALIATVERTSLQVRKVPLAEARYRPEVPPVRLSRTRQ